MNTRQIIDYAAEDNAKDFRESLYASIYDKVNAHIEAKKQEIAHTLVTQEAKECECDDEKEDEKEGHDDEKEDKALVKKMVKKDALKTEEVTEEELEESVTRKHFQQVADLIKTHDDAGKRSELAKHHAEIFAQQNPRFDRAKFMKAANASE
jgi:hypothetical protein